MEWAAIAAIAASVIGSVVNFFSTKSTNEKNAELMREQNEFNASQVDKQNAYNSPSAQVERVKAAGLNPSFFFGSGAGIVNTQSSAASGSGLPSLVAPQISSDSVARTLFDNQRLKNETIKTEAEIDKYLSESESLKTATQQAKDSYDERMKNIASQTFKNDADRLHAEELAKSEYARRLEMFKNIESMDYNIQLLQERANSERWTQQKLEAEIDRIYTLTPVEEKNLMSQYNLNEQNAKVAAATINKINQDVKNAVKEGRRIDALAFSQMMDNAVKEVRSLYDIEVADIMSSNALDWAIIDQLSGIPKSAAALGTYAGSRAFSDSNPVDRLTRAKIRKRDHMNSSWYFTE